MKHTLEFISAGSDVLRYHTVSTITRETVGHHSHGVAMMTLLIDPTASRQLICAALFHDLAEHQTGDIPTPAKREFGIGGQVEELEERLMLAAGIKMPYLNKQDKRTLKLADLAHGALYSAREVQMGNRRMRPVFDRYMGYAQEMILTGREAELFNIIGEYVQ